MYATEHQASLLRAAVEEIKKHPETFDMAYFANECGTVCCLAGHIAKGHMTTEEWQTAVADYWNDARHGNPAIVKKACELLNIHIDGRDEMALFVRAGWPDRFALAGDSSPEQLEARVEHWILTGE